MEEIELSQTDRQLLLYDIFFRSQQVEYEDITSRLPISKKMVQRDITIHICGRHMLMTSLAFSMSGFS